MAGVLGAVVVGVASAGRVVVSVAVSSVRGCVKLFSKDWLLLAKARHCTGVKGDWNGVEET